MFRLPLLWVFICMVHFCFAQQKKIDSLKDELKKHIAEDTIRINILNELSYASYQIDPEQGISFADKALELSKKIKDERRMAFAFQYKGINYSEKGEYAVALELFKQAGGILEKLNEQNKLMTVRNSTAIVYMRLSDYSKALELYYKNLHWYESQNQQKEVAMTNGNIALVYNLIGNADKALAFNQKAIDIRKKLNDEKELADLLNSRGNILDDMDKIEEARSYYLQSLYLCKKIGYTKGTTSACANLGNIFNESGQKDSAFYYTLFALSEYKKLGDKNNQVATLGYLGKMVSDADDEVLRKQGIFPSEKYAVALKYHKEALSLGREIENVYAQAEQLGEISNIYEKQNKYDKALDAFIQHAKLKNSIFNDEKKESIHQAEMQYVVQKKEDSLKLVQEKKDVEAKAEIQRQKTIKQFVVVAGGFFLMATLISFIFYKKRRDSLQKQQEAEFKTEMTDTEMKALRAQMNPHFIFNSLNSISDYIAKNDIMQADRYLGKFAKLMRIILENSEQKDVPLTNDLKALEFYMQLESLRMNNKFSYEIKVDGDIDKDITMVPPLLLQPFVENSIWHGIAPKEGTGKILIHIKKEGADMINCSVEDDGVGRQQAGFIKKAAVLQPEKSSLGMKITQARINILNSLKNTKAGVELIDLPRGMRVEVRLPLTTNF